MRDLFGREVSSYDYQGSMDVHFSSATDEWSTPEDVFAGLDSEFGFTLDAAASPDNHKCEKYFTKEDNGLIKDWAGERVYINPPYSEISKWMRKAFWEYREGVTVVALIPSRTDTRWWHKYVMRASEIRFIKGRLTFGGAENSAPFPSAVVIFKAD